jgi:hypothetical protein
LRTFWFKPDQHLWLVKLNDACGSSLCVGHVIQPDPPDHRDAGSRRDSLTGVSSSAEGGMLSRQLPTRPLPAAPVPVELLQTELQV